MPQHLREYDEDAAAGERLDPSNAYFPFMRAIGQFAAGQDAQAMASIERGSAKPNWNDYIGQELEAELGLYQVTYGVVSGLPRRAIVAAIIMPHLNEIQTAARLAIALAARMELHGHAALGLKIRQAILKCGGAMRVQSQQLIGNLVGRAVENMSIMRPGGVGQITRNANLSQAAWSALRLAELRAFFESTGHAGAYSEFEVELQRGQELRRITAQLQQVDFEESVWKSGVGWIVGLLLLSFAGWLTVLALVSSFVVSRVGRSENGRPKNRSGLMLVSCLLVGLISSWQISESLGPVVRMTWGFLSEGRPEPSRVVLAFAPVFVLGIPLTVLAVLAIVSLYRSIPVGDLIGRLLSRWAIPAIALLVFAYGLSVPFTVRQEAALNQTVDQIARNEGRFLAEGIGATWPP